MKATKTAASSTAKITCTCEHKKKLTKFPMSISASTHRGCTRMSSDAIRYFGLVRWEKGEDEGVYEMISAEGLAVFLSSLPL